MPIEVRKKEGESANAFIFRFNKRVKQSGILKEVKKKRFKSRVVNRRKKRLSALYRRDKKEEVMQMKKYGFGDQGKNR